MKSPELKIPPNKKFGYVFSFIFICVATYFLYFSSLIIGYALLIISIFFFVITLINPNCLLPLNKTWMRLGFFLGKIISPIVLSIIFFCLFTPYGLIMRFFGRDLLRLKKQKSKYLWIKRLEVSPQTNFKRQF